MSVDDTHLNEWRLRGLNLIIIFVTRGGEYLIKYKQREKEGKGNSTNSTEVAQYSESPYRKESVGNSFRKVGKKGTFGTILKWPRKSSNILYNLTCISNKAV